MGPYTIRDFWDRRLTTSGRPDPNALVHGWSFQPSGLPTFQEARLSLSAEFGNDDDPDHSSILLVSAPGAVGKSTLAREIAYSTDSIYIDLADAAPVGANTLTGGLARAGLYDAWQAGSVTALIDGLDEARLKVTQEAFQSFLADIADLSAGRDIPTVLFGRTGAIETAWVILDDTESKTSIAVLEIGYFDAESSLAFATSTVGSLEPSYGEIRRQALTLLLSSLRDQTSNDGDRFAGYAPVIQAVSEHVAAETNPGAFLLDIKRGSQPVSMQSIVTGIMERDRGKLRGLEFKDDSLHDRLYSHEEQLGHLVSRVYGVAPPGLPDMDPEDAQVYEAALKDWVSDHPFIDYVSSNPSSTVFDAVIATTALQSTSATAGAKALEKELRRGVANPFLSEFYLRQPELIQPEHVGVVYASARAMLSLGDSASLFLGVDDDDPEALAEMEITIARRDTADPRVISLHTEQSGTIILGGHIEDVDLALPRARVEIGAGPEAIIVAPVNIQCKELVVSTDKLIVEGPPGRESNAVLLEAQEYIGGMSQVPIIRGGVQLAASWPTATTYPWTAFAADPLEVTDNRQLDEALRRFRNFVIYFRSNRYGGLARYQGSVNHRRMTKGPGQAVLDLMLREGILTLEQPMYFLNAQRLSDLTGMSFRDCMTRNFSPEAISFVGQALRP